MFQVCDDINTLIVDSSDIAAIQLQSATAKIDDEFGAGYAKKHPLLVGEIVRAASLHFLAAVVANAVSEAIGVLRLELSDPKIDPPITERAAEE